MRVAVSAVLKVWWLNLVKIDLPELHEGTECRTCHKVISVRFQTSKYQKDGIFRTGFSWISCKCNCGTAIIYWNGVFRVIPAEFYDPNVSKLRKLGSDIKIKVKGSKGIK